LAVTTVLVAMFGLCGSASAAFYINCAGCHTAPQSGMAILSFQTTTNLGNGLRKVFEVRPGQTAVIQLNVTNNYGGSYALNLNNFDAGGVNNGSDHLAYNADLAWSHRPALAQLCRWRRSGAGSKPRLEASRRPCRARIIDLSS
jgi:hypothetical protein